MQADQLQPGMREAMRPGMTKPMEQRGGAPAVVSLGPLLIDTFAVLVDTFPITFA